MLSNRFTRFTIFVSALILTLATLACSINLPATPPPPITVTVTPPPAIASPEPGTRSAPLAGSPTVTPSTAPAPSTVTATAPITRTFAPTATLKTTTNIRSGPGAQYAILGNLAAGLSVRLTGRNADQSWWQIEFSASPNGRAWVLATNTNVITGTDALPVASAPPPPTRVPSPPTSVPVIATAAPRSDLAVFRADRDKTAAGECTTLRWDVNNAQSVFVFLGSEEVPVTEHDTRTICPEITTVYKLRVVSPNGSTQQYTFTVAVNQDCGNSADITRYEASALEIKTGASVTLSWDVTCAQGVFFKEGKNAQQQVGSHDAVEVQPEKSTTYRLIAVNKDGSEVRRDITINVVP